MTQDWNTMQQARDLEDIPGLAMEALESHLSSMEVEEVRPSLHWILPSTLSTSSSITGGCSSRPSSTLSTPCSSSSTMDPRPDLRARSTRLTSSPGLRLSSSRPSPINTRVTTGTVLLLANRDTRNKLQSKGKEQRSCSALYSDGQEDLYIKYLLSSSVIIKIVIIHLGAHRVKPINKQRFTDYKTSIK